MLDAGEGDERLGDRRVGHAELARDPRRGRCVLAVVGAADPRLGGQRLVGAPLDRLPGALEDAELRVAVRLEGAVAVEMVGLEVQ